MCSKRAIVTCIFQLASRLEVIEFNPFPILPVALSKIFPYEIGYGEKFPNYSKYLTKIPLLAKPVAFHFLSVFKKHFEDIQVAVGKIEAWITELAHALPFINEYVGKELAPPGLGEGVQLSKHPVSSVIGDYPICVKCFHVSIEHNACGGFSCRNIGGYGLFFVPTDVILLQVTLETRGTMKLKFQLSSEADQDKYKQFMKFVRAAETEKKPKEKMYKSRAAPGPAKTCRIVCKEISRCYKV